jgi:hypothetical protein
VDGFKKWLILERKLSSNSARVYASQVRTLLKAAPSEGVTPAFVDSYLGENKNKRTAYRVFRDWMKVSESLDLPPLAHRPSGRPAKYKEGESDEGVVYGVPDAVLDAVGEIMQGAITRKLLSQLMWGFLTFNEKKDRYECPTPGDVKSTTVLATGPILIIRNWASPAPGKEGFTPLVPRNPGSLKPVNWSWLEMTIEVRRRSRETC